MKLLFDFFPIVLFFIIYKLYGIYAATGVLIVASILQVLYTWLKHKRIDGLVLITCAMAIALGSITIILKNEIFIKWKPSVIYWLLAAAFLFSQFIGNKPIVQRMLQDNMKLPKHIWFRLNLSWVIFFASMGLLNVYVVYNFSTDAWVNFKLLGILGLTILFVILQAIYLSKYIAHDSTDNDNTENGA